MPKVLHKVIGLILLLATVGLATCQSMIHSVSESTDSQPILTEKP